MSAAPIQDYKMTDADPLNEVKGHLEIALLEKHFLRECSRYILEVVLHHRSSADFAVFSDGFYVLLWPLCHF